MDTSTEASTTSRYCTFCHKTRPHRGETCTTCGTPIEHWPAGPGVEPADRTGDPWAHDGLSVRQMMVLDFEGRGWWAYQGAKITAIREELGYGATHYYQVLNALLDNPDAEAYAPMTVRRLRRLRDDRKAQRSARRLSG